MSSTYLRLRKCGCIYSGFRFTFHASRFTLAEARPKRLVRHDDVFHVAKKLEAPVAAFAPDARAFDAAERCHEIADPEGVIQMNPVRTRCATAVACSVAP